MSAKMARSEILPNIIFASSGDIGGPREEESEAVDTVRDEEFELAGVIGVLCIGPDKQEVSAPTVRPRLDVPSARGM